MLDRFDLMIEVPEVPIHQMLEKTEQESSATIRERVLAAQNFAARRHQGGSTRLNADLSPDEIDQAVGLDDDALALLHQAVEKQALSARGLHRVLRVARTIADLDGDDQTRSTHLAEALRYRRLPSES